MTRPAPPPWLPAARRRRSRMAVVAASTLALGALASPAHAYEPPSTIARASIGTGGVEAEGPSKEPAVSADGRFVALESVAENLVPGDTNHAVDIFVHDRHAGATERVSISSGGEQTDFNSRWAAISADGRYVAFESEASTLLPGGEGRSHVYVHDRQTSETVRASVAGDGEAGNDDSRRPEISADGRSVSFRSEASNLIPGDTNGITDHFVHDLDSGVTERVNVSSSGEQVTLPYYADQTSISEDGRFVAFAAVSPLVPEDTNGLPDVYVRDRLTGTTERASVASDGSQGTWTSAEPVLSADGRLVLFVSMADNFTPGDGNMDTDVFVRDRETDRTEMVSVTSAGEAGDDGSFRATLSPDGRFVAFSSFATNLAPDIEDYPTDVYLHDRVLGVTRRAALGWNGRPPMMDARNPSLSEGGRVVAFDSPAPNLVKKDWNFEKDVFVVEAGPPVGVGAVDIDVVEGAVEVSGWARVAGTEMSSATDPADDGLAPAASGAEIVEAAVMVRPEIGDLLVRMRLAEIPGRVPWMAVNGPVRVENQALVPEHVYGLDLVVAGDAFEVRGSLRPHTGWGLYPGFALFRCEAICEQVSELEGGLGATGDEMRAAVPISLLGLDGETAGIGGLRAWTAAGVMESGSVAVLDDLNLPDGVRAEARIDLAIAAAGTPEEEVDFEGRAALDNGRFDGSIDTSVLAPGGYDVWARACLGDQCRASSKEVTL